MCSNVRAVEKMYSPQTMDGENVKARAFTNELIGNYGNEPKRRSSLLARSTWTVIRSTCHPEIKLTSLLLTYSGSYTQMFAQRMHQYK